MIAGLALFPLTALGIGGIPYIVLAVFLLHRFRDKPADFYQRFSFVAPIVFAIFLWFCLGLLFLVVSGPTFPVRERLLAGGYYAAIAVPVGYACVGLVHALSFVLRKRGVIRESAVQRGNGADRPPPVVRHRLWPPAAGLLG